MHFNKAELAALVTNPTIEFDKEGILGITERQEGFLRTSDVNSPRWCKLRGNLLFYLKDQYLFSPPAGLLVLENCRPIIHNNGREIDGFAFFLEFENPMTYPIRICANTAKDRGEWVKYIQLASYVHLNRQIDYLQKQILNAMGNRIETGVIITDTIQTPSDAGVPNEYLTTNSMSNNSSNNQIAEDIFELPICESALSCDNLPCDCHGRAPNARIVCSVLNIRHNCMWHDFAHTEIVESTVNPQFLHTIRFRKSDGFTAASHLRFTVYDVREKMTSTAVPIGYAEVDLGVIQDATRFRIPLCYSKVDNSFITIASWSSDMEKQVPTRSITQVFEQQKKGHRRSQSLPPKLGTRLFVPFQSYIQTIFANPAIRTYRLSSTMGRDIAVHEYMLESKLCFNIPQQLLNIWIQREKELLQELSGMGELGGMWRRRQLDLLDKHLKLLTDYSQAKQNMQQFSKEKTSFFKRSSVKTDESLEFLPVNLHLQRMWANNDTLHRMGVLDIITVGAFARHTVKSSSGGLIKLLQEAKESPSKMNEGNSCKVQAANDAVHAIKQLRKEIVEIMSELLSLARSKNPKGMIAHCNDIIAKTKTLLNICEPILVEEAFSFIEEHRIIEEPENPIMPISPFRKITQQLGALDLKSPELEDFATPVVEPPDLWPNVKTRNYSLSRSKSWNSDASPSAVDMRAVYELQHNIKDYNAVLKKRAELEANEAQEELAFQSLPIHWQQNTDSELPTEQQNENENCLPIEDCESNYIACSYKRSSARFLDAKIMSSSPSANYYRPTEEPEPYDLIQLNIEASVMCLVSKIKFFCGRCGSPAIRLRHPNHVMKREGFSNSMVKTPPDVLVNKNPLQLNLNSATTANKKGNKFTEGLDLSLTTDWTGELRPSMRKLRHAMDGLLKTARLIHSVQRLQQDTKHITQNLEIMYQRDVCFSQAVTALVSGLMAKLWGTEVTENFFRILIELGPVVYFEGLLSMYGRETDFWGDMCIAIEDLCSLNFTLAVENFKSGTIPQPHITGTRQALQVILPVPEEVFQLLPKNQNLTFKVTPVFFNIGINEKATLAESLGMTRKQTRSNWDNYVRLKQYYSRFNKLNVLKPEQSTGAVNLLNFLEKQLKTNVPKNIKILHIAEDLCRLLQGLRFTSCKSAKDRTGMAVTLEQCRVLVQEFNLPANTVPLVLRTMRSEGTRMENVFKNIDMRKYAFNLPQVLSLPAVYRPPVGTYGKAET